MCKLLNRALSDASPLAKLGSLYLNEKFCKTKRRDTNTSSAFFPKLIWIDRLHVIRLVWPGSRFLAVCQMLNTDPLNLYKLGTTSMEKVILVLTLKSLQQKRRIYWFVNSRHCWFHKQKRRKNHKNSHKELCQPVILCPHIWSVHFQAM